MIVLETVKLEDGIRGVNHASVLEVRDQVSQGKVVAFGRRTFQSLDKLENIRGLIQSKLVQHVVYVLGFL